MVQLVVYIIMQMVTDLFQKERTEIFSQGRIIQLDNYRKLKAYGWPGF